jgi:hypothetical protein
MSRKLLPILLLAVFAVGLMEASAWAQCSMCRTALEQSEEGRALAGSFRYGILFLLVAPYAMFGGAGFLVFRAYRRRALDQNPDSYENQSDTQHP